MRGGGQRIPKYCRHKTGQAFTRIRGKHIYLGLYDSEESRTKYQRVIAGYLSRQPIISAKTTPSIRGWDLTLHYWEARKADYLKNGKATTEHRAWRSVIAQFNKLFADLPISDFGPSSLITLRQSWVELGIARQSINRNVRKIVELFRWAVESELVQPSVWQALQAVKGLRKGRTSAPEPTPVKPVQPVAVTAVLPHLSPQLAAMVQLQSLLGCRPSEICGMRPCDIDRTSAVWIYTPASHKTDYCDRSREIYIGPQAQKLLRTWLKSTPPDSHCFSAAASREWYRQQASLARQTQHSCGNARGRKHDRKPGPGTHQPRDCFDSSSYAHAIRRACLAAKILHWSPNQLRHTRATEIRAKHGLEAAQVILGHASANVTQIYAQRDRALGIKVAKQSG